MVDVTIKLASIDDLDATAALFDLYRQFYGQPENVELAKSFIKNRMTMQQSSILLGINSVGHAVGFCQLYPSFCSVIAQPIFVLYDLFVVPEARKLGVGKLLLLDAERLASEHRMARMDLTTAKDNKAAQSVYESLGWVRDEIFYTYNRNIVSS